MRRKAILFTVILFVMVFLHGCYVFQFSNRTPVYEREDSEQDGIVVIVDGIKYKQLPELKWREQRHAETFGYAGKDKDMLFACENDPDRNFIFFYDDSDHQLLDEFHGVLLYRADGTIPPPAPDSVDRIFWNTYDFTGSESKQKAHSIYENELIKLFFDELKKNEDTRAMETDTFHKRSLSITCYSNMVPGSDYEVWFEHRDGKLVAGNKIDGYVEFSPDVLEEIVGYEIDMDILLMESD